jgi:single-strand DNA-binding protein
MNKVFLIGVVVRDPEIRYTSSGDAKARFTVVTEERWKDKATGEPKKHSEFHNCVLYGKRAETLAEWFKKGKAIQVEGKNRTREYTPEGSTEKKKITEIHVEDFNFVPGGRGAGSSQPAQNDDNEAAPQPSSNKTGAPRSKPNPSFEHEDEAIPF